MLESLNSGELSQRRFREIARVSGLVFQGFPGAHKGTRQLQASSSLFYEVFLNHDPENLLLAQARREVLEQELEISRLRASLERLGTMRLHRVAIARPTPFAFPLLVDRLREQLSTEKLSDRVARMVRELEAAAGPGPGIAATAIPAAPGSGAAVGGGGGGGATVTRSRSPREEACRQGVARTRARRGPKT